MVSKRPETSLSSRISGETPRTVALVAERRIGEPLLKTLGQVPWQQLQHAYGPATDVPGLLRKVASGGDSEREQALRELWGNVWHQGTVYEASAPVVPYLSELARADNLPTQIRASLLLLIGSIAGGSSYLDVHASLVRAGLTDEEQKQLAQELKWVRAARQAVAAELDQLFSQYSSMPAELHFLLANVAAQLDLGGASARRAEANARGCEIRRRADSD